MPPVGGFVALCAQAHHRPVEIKPSIVGDFSKIEFSPNSDTLKGNLLIHFDTYRICHGGVKVLLKGYLNLNEVNNEKSINVFRPAQTILEAGELLHGQKRLKFNLTIPSDRPYPTPFMTSKGSLAYMLIAIIARDGFWKTLAWKYVNFKGYHNVSHMDLNPFVETKITKIETGEVMATFRVPNTVVVMGQGEGLKASLELHGVLNCQVNATLTFFRNTTYVGNIHTENILSQNKCVEIHQNDTLIKWTVVVPVMKRISYSDETITKYSVRYYLKYEVFVVQLDVKEGCAAIKGVVQIEVGTTRDAFEFKACDNATNVATNRLLVPSCPPLMSAATTDRRKSVVSLLSVLSLPPAYSLLSSRSGSMMSLETQPPQYDELKNRKGSLQSD